MEVLEKDIDLQDILIVNLERAVQVSVDIGTHILSDYEVTAPLAMADVFRSLAHKEVIDAQLAENLARSVGFRNIAVHQYQSINWHIVYAIITTRLEDFRRFSGYVSRLIEQ